MRLCRMCVVGTLEDHEAQATSTSGGDDPDVAVAAMQRFLQSIANRQRVRRKRHLDAVGEAVVG